MADIYSAGHAIAAMIRRDPTPNAQLATDPQIKYIEALLDKHDWRNASLPAKHIGRAATVNMCITWAVNAADTSIVPDTVHEMLKGVETMTVRVNMILDVMRKPEPDQTRDYAEHAYLWAPLTKSGASKMIEWLQTIPLATTSVEDDAAVDSRVGTAQAPDADLVPAGRYAVATSDGATNVVAFYKVDRPTDGKWAGHVFVKLMKSDEEIRLSRKAAQGVLAKIAADGAEQASLRYGHLIGACGVCGRTLTNDASRAAGIGPKCAAGMGW